MGPASLEEEISRLITLTKGYPKSREMSLVITKLEEAQLWLTQVKYEDENE